MVVWQGDDIFVGKAGTHRGIISDDELMPGRSVVRGDDEAVLE